jgi:hypothetical protein
MSGRTAAALCLAAFFATSSPTPVWEWMSTTWNALTAAVEEPTSNPDEEPEVVPGRGDDGWLIDPNG